MIKLKIILKSNYIYVILIITLLVSFFRINYIPNKSKIIPTNYFIGTIRYIDRDGETYKIYIKNKEEIIGYYKSLNELDLELGDLIKVYGVFSEPSNNTIPNTFNYKKYLNNHHIFYQININKIDLLSKNKNIVFKIKNLIIKKTESLKNKAYIKAFIIGDKKDLEIYDLYQNNGVSHLFAISGMHISLFSSFLYFLFKKCKYQNLIVIIFLSLYLNIINNSSSILRCYIFLIIIILNKKYNLNINTKNILIITCIILVNYNPYIIYDYGFLYSSITTYGLILSTKYYRKNYFFNLLITSFIAFLFSLPITLRLNYEINLLSFLNNLIVVPLISIIIYPLSLIVFIFPFLECILTIMIFILEKINYLLSLISIFVVIPKINICFYIIYYVLIIIFIKSNNKRFIMLGILVILVTKFKIYLMPSSVIYFNVNQGDSAFISFNNKNILIDTGGINGKNFSKNTIKYIKSIGYSHIDYLVLTHGDYDHMGEAVNLVDNFKVEKVIFNCYLIMN